MAGSASQRIKNKLSVSERWIKCELQNYLQE